MPKIKPDRDDARGLLAGNGGPQDGPIGDAGDRRQQQDGDELDAAGIGGGGTGVGGQRHPGGSSRDVKP